MNEIKCPHCGQSIPDDSIFCPECGKRIVEEKSKPETKSKKGLIILLCLFGVAIAVLLFLLLSGKSDSSDDNDDEEKTEKKADADYEKTDEESSANTVQYDNNEKYSVEEKRTDADEYGYSFDTEEIPDDVLEGMSKSNLELLRNSIYAWHGYIFTRSDLQDFFNNEPWYHGRTSNMSDIHLNKIEQKNVAKIQKYEKNSVKKN